jgi:signal transduction histidine kinase
LVDDFDRLASADGRKVHLVAEHSCTVLTDRRYCKQILHTLLSNALIHGRGDISVRLRHRGSRARFTLVNQTRSTPTRSELTLGLGLRVVRALVEQQPEMRFFQHHGRQTHATVLVFPARSGGREFTSAAPAQFERAGI